MVKIIGFDNHNYFILISVLYLEHCLQKINHPCMSMLILHKVASRRPLECSFSSSFVVDVSKLAHPDDIKKDMYGKWLHSGSHTDVFRCTFSDGDNVYIELEPVQTVA